MRSPIDAFRPRLFAAGCTPTTISAARSSNSTSVLLGAGMSLEVNDVRLLRIQAIHCLQCGPAEPGGPQQTSRERPPKSMPMDEQAQTGGLRHLRMLELHERPHPFFPRKERTMANIRTAQLSDARDSRVVGLRSRSYSFTEQRTSNIASDRKRRRRVARGRGLGSHRGYSDRRLGRVEVPSLSCSSAPRFQAQRHRLAVGLRRAWTCSLSRGSASGCNG